MRDVRKLPLRERVFVLSLMYHGYRFTRKRLALKRKRGYVIPATKQEDAAAIDFWVKLPGGTDLIPIQITQRGIRIFRKRSAPSVTQLEEFERTSERRIRTKRQLCQRNKIVFVLVRDHDGPRTSRSLAWGDIKALRFGMARYIT